MGSRFTHLTLKAPRRPTHLSATTMRFSFFDPGEALTGYSVQSFFTWGEVKRA
mgnify:CR=1 FL=1